MKQGITRRIMERRKTIMKERADEKSEGECKKGEKKRKERQRTQ